MPRRSSRATDVRAEREVEQKTSSIPVDLAPSGPANHGVAGAGHVSVTGWVFDADHRLLGGIDAQGVVRRGRLPVALVQGHKVIPLEDHNKGKLLGTIRAVVRPAYQLAYLCGPTGQVQAFMMVDRKICGIGEKRLLQLAGAALALLGTDLDP